MRDSPTDSLRDFLVPIAQDILEVFPHSMRTCQKPKIGRAIGQQGQYKVLLIRER